MLLTVCPVLAHDMWIEPRAFQSAVDAVVGVQLRIGDRPAEAKPVVRDPQRIIRFVAVDSQGETPVIGRAGMDPAGFLRPKQVGLRVLGYHSQPSFIELEAKQFESYLAEEGLEAMALDISRFLLDLVYDAATELDYDEWLGDEMVCGIDLSDRVLEDEITLIFPDSSEVDLVLHGPVEERKVLLLDKEQLTAELVWKAGLKIVDVAGMSVGNL